MSVGYLGGFNNGYPVVLGVLGNVEIKSVQDIYKIRSAYFENADYTINGNNLIEFFKAIKNDYSADIYKSVAFFKAHSDNENLISIEQVLQKTLFPSEYSEYQKWVSQFPTLVFKGYPIISSSEFKNMRNVWLADINYLTTGSDSNAYWLYNKIYDHILPAIRKIISAFEINGEVGGDTPEGQNNFAKIRQRSAELLASILFEGEANAYYHWANSQLPMDEFNKFMGNAIKAAVIAGTIYVSAGAISSAFAGSGAVGEGVLAGQTGLLTGEVAQVGTIGLEAGSSVGIIGGEGILGGSIAVEIGGATAAETILESILSGGKEVVESVVKSQIVKEIKDVVSPTQPKQPTAPQPQTVNSNQPIKTGDDFNNFLNNNKEKIGLALTVLAGAISLM